jgi:hypothetical protein
VRVATVITYRGSNIAPPGANVLDTSMTQLLATICVLPHTADAHFRISFKIDLKIRERIIVLSVNMGDYDTTATVLRGKGAGRPGANKSEAQINAARRRGEEVSTEQKFGGGGNRQGGTSLNTATLDRETEELKHASVCTASRNEFSK